MQNVVTLNPAGGLILQGGSIHPLTLVLLILTIPYRLLVFCAKKLDPSASAVDKIRTIYQSIRCGNPLVDECYSYVGNNIAVTKDPNAIESVLRAEGKYPVRDSDSTVKLRWLFENKTNLPPSLALW